MNLKPNSILLIASLVVVLGLWAVPVLADPPPPPPPPPPKIDWSEFKDLLQEDPEIAVGEELC